MRAATLLHVLGLVSSTALASVLEAGASLGYCRNDPFQHLHEVCMTPDAGEASSVTGETLTMEPTPQIHGDFPAIPLNAAVGTASADESGDQDNPDFVSFEEWKERRLAEESRYEPAEEIEPRAGDSDGGSQSAQLSPEPAAVSDESQHEVHVDSGKESSAAPVPPPPKRSAQHSHRYNYASPDCSARIHSASPRTQNPNALLHKSKDRYMLTPCGAAEHWVVVELCDEIRIEAVELGMFEFFSGVVRDVVVSVGGEDGDDWEVVGNFTARNIRGVQSFTLPQATSFHRFLKLEFPSHYGTEFYCPVSSLKAYGLNQMEAFKAEQKRVNFEREQQTEEDRAREEKRREERRRMEEERRQWEKEEELRRETELEKLERLVVLAGLELEAAPPVHGPGLLGSALRNSADIAATASNTEIKHISTSLPTAPASSSTSSTPASSSTSATSVTADKPTAQNLSSTPSVSSVRQLIPSAGNGTAVKPLSTSVASSSQQQAPQQSARPAPARADSSESIYAFIIRRLTALEGNSTLTTRYIEEQMRSTRHLLLRIEKGWAEWKKQKETDETDRREVEMMKTEQRLGRLASQIEQQRMAAEQDRRFVEAQLRTLTDELAFERRRGIAQLIILLVLLALGVLTRGAKMEAVLMPLLNEARRRSVSNRRNRLSGLSFDLGRGGLKKPEEANNGIDAVSPAMTGHDTLRSPIPRKGTPRSGSLRRPMTPTTVKRRSTPGRSFSLHEDDASVGSHTPTPGHLVHPRPRVSLEPGGRANGGVQRKLARSAHLHTIEADRVRSDLRQSGLAPTSRAVSTSSDGTDSRHISPLSGSSVVFPPMPAPPSDGGSTDYEATEASASEVEEDVMTTGSVFDDLRKELTDAWNGK